MAAQPQPTEPIAATVLSGFLGSGKTTLLNALLRAPHGRKLAVIVNEFGAIGVDGALVRGGEQFVELDNGCLCCALNADLTRTLHALLGRGGFDHVVIETTGLAEPLPVARTFDKPGLAQAYRMDAVVTVIDGPHAQQALQQAAEARAQIEQADVLLLNKCDLLDAAHQAALGAQLRAINPQAAQFSCARGEGLPWHLLLATGIGPRAAADPAPAAHAHRASFSSWSYPCAAPFDELRLEDLLAELPAQVYRCKGVVRTNAPWDWTLVNAVAGRMEMRPFAGVAERVRPGLVFIGAQLDEHELARRCAAARVCDTP